MRPFNCKKKELQEERPSDDGTGRPPIFFNSTALFPPGKADFVSSSGGRCDCVHPRFFTDDRNGS
jgi:hypothetical protein